MKKLRKVLLTLLAILFIFIQPAFANNKQEISVKAYYYQSECYPSPPTHNVTEIKIQYRSDHKITITVLNISYDDIYIKHLQKVQAINIYCKDRNDIGFLPDVSLIKK